jgi:hypothetical protein
MTSVLNHLVIRTLVALALLTALSADVDPVNSVPSVAQIGLDGMRKGLNVVAGAGARAVTVAASDIRERIATLLDADPVDEEFPYVNEATGVDALFTLDDDLLTVTVNFNRPACFIREVLDVVDEIHHESPLLMPDPARPDAEDAPMIAYERDPVLAQWQVANDWACRACAASAPIAPERVMEDAALMESWRWNYTCEMTAQVWASMGQEFERLPVAYIVHGGRAARLAQWTGIPAVLPHADVVYVACLGQEPCLVEHANLVNRLGARVTPTEDGLQIAWDDMPADIRAFLSAQPVLTRPLRGLHVSDLVEASVVRRVSGDRRG